MKSLFDKCLLITVQEATFNSSRIIAFNKDFETWSRKLHESKSSTGIENDSSTGIENDSSTGIENDSHRKKPLKKPIKETCASPFFDVFWTAYPKKRAKADAVKAFSKIKDMDAALFEKIMAALAIQKQSPDWQKESGQFVPYPATWLNGKRWEDEIPATDKPDRFKDVIT